MQKSKAESDRAELALFAISYDPVAVLAAFATKRGIEYDLLSDEGSRMIRELGLLNEHLDAQHAHYGVASQDHHKGVPYPGTFLLDEQGVVIEKKFEQSYRVRPTTAALVEAALGAPAGTSGPTAEAVTDDLKIVAGLDSSTYHPYQKLRLRFAIAIAPGLHVYGEPVPEGLTSLSVHVQPPEGLEVGPTELPAPHPFAVEGFDEDLSVYEGTVRGEVPVVLIKNVG
ncbi:MAG: redoxin domain-containing protein, partial [Chloroflexota bacterium]